MRIFNPGQPLRGVRDAELMNLAKEVKSRVHKIAAKMKDVDGSVADLDPLKDSVAVHDFRVSSNLLQFMGYREMVNGTALFEGGELTSMRAELNKAPCRFDIAKDGSKVYLAPVSHREPLLVVERPDGTLMVDDSQSSGPGFEQFVSDGVAE